jgi:type II secretion system protein L
LADHAVVRTGTYQGFGCDLLNIAGMLTAALQSTQQKPAQLYAYEYAVNGPWHGPDELPCAKEIFDRRAWFVNSASVLLKTPYLNLLQGAYRTKQTMFLKKDKLRQTLLAFAVAWLGLLLLYPTISYFILSRHASELSTEIAAIYHRYYPESKEVVAPKIRLEEKLRDLNSEDVDNQLLMMLAYLGQALTKTPPIELKRVDYQNNKMTVEFMAASSPDYAKFTGLLTDSGVRVKEQSANLSGKQILATIILEY